MPNGFSMMTRRQPSAHSLQQPGLAEMGDHRREHRGRRREVEQHIVPAGLRQPLAERPKGRRLREIALEIGHPLTQPLPLGAILRARGEVAHAGVERAPEGLVARLGAGDTDDRKIVGQQPATPQIAERGHQQAPGEIPGGAKNHQHARWRRLCDVGHAAAAAFAATRPPNA